MEKEEIDELYHNLRKLCVTDDIFQKEAIGGLVSHLVGSTGDYAGLLRFLSYYGEKYTLTKAVSLLRHTEHLFTFSRIIELGAGFAWLGRGLLRELQTARGQRPAKFVDKRQWVFTDIVADIETVNGARRVLDELQQGDLIVMSELLHCLDNPKEVLRPFRKWPMLVVEYWPLSSIYRDSYEAQICKFNCKPVKNIRDVFPDAKIIDAPADPYMIWLVLPL